MRSDRETQALRDIVANFALARLFTDGLSFGQFVEDKKTLYATVRCLEIVSEASRRLSAEAKGRSPDIDWRGVATVGNVYRHEYGKVDPAAVWDALLVELEPLQAAIEAELARPTA